MVDGCFEVSLFCICAAMISILLKQHCREHSVLLSVFVCASVIGGAVKFLSPILESISEMFSLAGVGEGYTSLIFKATAICVITDITKNICYDCGETALASAADFWGRAVLTLISLPLLRTVVDLIKEVL